MIETLSPLSTAVSLIVIESLTPVALLSVIARSGVRQIMFAVVNDAGVDVVLPQVLIAVTRQKYVVFGSRPPAAWLVAVMPGIVCTIVENPASVAISSVYVAVFADAAQLKVGEVLVPLAPFAGEDSVGAAGAPVVRTSWVVAEWPGLADAVPLTVIVDVPATAAPFAVRVIVELPPGVTGFGENAAVTPAGSPLAASVTAFEKLNWLPTLTV